MKDPFLPETMPFLALGDLQAIKQQLGPYLQETEERMTAYMQGQLDLVERLGLLLFPIVERQAAEIARLRDLIREEWIHGITQWDLEHGVGETPSQIQERAEREWLESDTYKNVFDPLPRHPDG